MGPLKPRTRRNGAAKKGGVAERGPERSEDRKCPLRSAVAAARFRVDLSTATDLGGEAAQSTSLHVNTNRQLPTSARS